MPQTEKQKIGEIGENIAVKHLEKLKYKVIERNYRKKWGEIDIIAKKDKILHFIEVKSVSRLFRKRNMAGKACETSNSNVSHETFDDYLPEENVHPWKLKRLSRAIQTYLIEKKVSDETQWQLDVMAVFIDLKTKKAKIRITQDVGL